MTVKDAKSNLQSLIDALNTYNEDADFYMNIYDNCGGYYMTDFEDWMLDDTTGEIVLTIE